MMQAKASLENAAGKWGERYPPKNAPRFVGGSTIRASDQSTNPAFWKTSRAEIVATIINTWLVAAHL